MEIRNCKRCGKIFKYNGVHKICKNCRKKEEEDYMKVKEFLEENPKANINIVSKETDVDKKIIIDFIKQNRIIATNIEIDTKLRCKRCGKEITQNKYCKECLKELRSEIESFNTKKTKRNKTDLKKRANMHLSDRIKKNDGN